MQKPRTLRSPFSWCYVYAKLNMAVYFTPQHAEIKLLRFKIFNFFNHQAPLILNIRAKAKIDFSAYLQNTFDVKLIQGTYSKHFL